MKTKRFVKKMVLNKMTISHLNNVVMNGVQGGKFECVTGARTTCYTPAWTCPTCDPTIIPGKTCCH